jgi:phosphoribosylaminoimidazolecarboxamide formyltransferase/IMP cyclohydrolase
VTDKKPSPREFEDLVFANKLVKHTKSNTIVLAKNKQLLASGCGMTSRVDALKFAITKANAFGFDLNEAVMASDAFFPFPDCVEIAGNIRGWSRQLLRTGRIDYCNKQMANYGHFKHYCKKKILNGHGGQGKYLLTH